MRRVAANATVSAEIDPARHPSVVEDMKCKKVGICLQEVWEVIQTTRRVHVNTTRQIQKKEKKKKEMYCTKAAGPTVFGTT
jgi:hypothetical protein